MTKKYISYFFSSSAAAGAVNVASDNSSFSVNLNNPLHIPREAKSAELSVQQANIWNISNNISVSLGNNVFAFTAGGVPRSITLQDGLYSLSGLQTAISTQLINLGLSANLFTFSGDYSTQKSIVSISNIADSVNFTVDNSIRTVLGFNSEVLTATVVNESFYSENIAAFNSTNSYLIRSDITLGGIPINGNASGIIASVPISVQPGSQIIYQPNVLTPIMCDELIGQRKLNINFYLLNQDLVSVGTPGSPWSVVIIIKFNI